MTAKDIILPYDSLPPFSLKLLLSQGENDNPALGEDCGNGATHSLCRASH
jgi:hypothetical protein